MKRTVSVNVDIDKAGVEQKHEESIALKWVSGASNSPIERRRVAIHLRFDLDPLDRPSTSLDCRRRTRGARSTAVVRGRERRINDMTGNRRVHSRAHCTPVLETKRRNDRDTLAQKRSGSADGVDIRSPAPPQ